MIIQDLYTGQQQVIYINKMKSISIVYKRPKTNQQLVSHSKTETRTGPNEYYTRILERGVNRQQLYDRIRSQTAQAVKMRDRKNIVSSLSIAAISSPQPNLFKSQTARKIPICSPVLQVKKSQPTMQTLFALKLPQQQTQDALLLKLTNRVPNKEPSTKHAQIKILLNKVKPEKEATLVVSVDFIYNEFNFWGNQEIQQGALKPWRALTALTNLVWIVRRESTYKKLVQFTQAKGLRLDGVVQVIPNKKQSLTVSFTNFQNQVKLNRNHKLLIINAIRSTNSDTNLSQLQFRSSLPVISHPSTFVHFVRIDMNNRHRFFVIKKVVTQQLPAPLDLKVIFQQYKAKKSKPVSKLLNMLDEEQEKQQQQDDQISNVLAQLQRIKANFILYFEQSFGLRMKLDGNSLAYIIGDMLKRNYGIVKQYYAYCQQTKQRSINTIRQANQSPNFNRKALEYTRKVYFWEP